MWEFGVSCDVVTALILAVGESRDLASLDLASEAWRKQRKETCDSHFSFLAAREGMEDRTPIRNP